MKLGSASSRSAGHWRPRHLPRTREEAREARVVVLGRHFATIGTGACSAASAGESQSRSGSGLSGICFDAHNRVRAPGGVATAVGAASSQDDSEELELMLTASLQRHADASKLPISSQLYDQLLDTPEFTLPPKD